MWSRMLNIIFWLVFGSIVLLGCIYTIANAEEPTDAWVLCQPDSYINVRYSHNKSSEVIGWLLSGDPIHLDGLEKNGYLHIVNFSNEYGEGWVAKGFVVRSEPVQDGHEYLVQAKGRVAARRTVEGHRRCWLHNNDILTVYMRSNDWCLTNQGFVKTEFIDLDCPLDIPTPSPDEMTVEED